MTLIAITSAKHSPGATTLAVAVAALAAEQQPAMVIELDPAGGDIAARAGLRLEPGLGTLAGAARRGITTDLLAHHLQPLASGAQALVAPSTREHATTAIRSLAARLPLALVGHDALAIVDLGRWQPDHPVADILGSSAMTMLVITPTVEGVEHARNRLPCLMARSERVLTVTVGDRPYREEEISRALGCPVVALPIDRRGAEAVGAGLGLDRWLRRTAFVRAVRVVFEQAGTPRLELTAEPVPTTPRSPFELAVQR